MAFKNFSKLICLFLLICCVLFFFFNKLTCGQEEDEKVLTREELRKEINEEKNANGVLQSDSDIVIREGLEDEDLLEKTEEEKNNIKEITDPRLGECTIDELKQIENYFRNDSKSVCNAYQCIDENYEIFYNKLLNNYASKYKEKDIIIIANVFSACWCRCPMMECELDYVNTHTTNKCISATKDYCKKQNTDFVQRCVKTANAFPDIYDTYLDPAGFKSPCAVCIEDNDVSLSASALSPHSQVISLEQEQKESVAGEMKENEIEEKLTEKLKEQQQENANMNLTATRIIEEEKENKENIVINSTNITDNLKETNEKDLETKILTDSSAASSKIFPFYLYACILFVTYCF